MATDWPNHPDGRPMKMRDLSREQQIAVTRGAVQQVKAELENPEVQAAMAKALAEPVNLGKRAIAKLPSGKEVIRDFPAGMEPSGFGWRLTWTGPAATDTGYRRSWSRNLDGAAIAGGSMIRRLIADGCHTFQLEVAPMVDTGQPAGDLAAFLRGKA